MRRVIWLLALGLFVTWAVAKFALGKSGFVHILILCAVAVAVVQWVADRRAARS
jgi:FtsH-binding integral membrane protein